MSLPGSLTDLLLADKLPQRWEHNFGPYQWFRLPGFADRLKKLRVPYRKNGSDCSIFHRDCVKLMRSEEFRAEAAKRLPPAWLDEYPHLPWDGRIGDRALVNLLHGSDTALPLDRAGHALAAVDTLLAQHGLRDIPLVDHVRIAPAIYRVLGYETFAKAVFAGAKGRELYEKLQKKMNNFEDPFYSDVADGHCMTYPTAQTLLKAMVQLFPEFKGEVKAITAVKREVRQHPDMKSADSLRPVRNEVLSF